MIKNFDHNRLFLNDALGALLTACIHGFILTRITQVTGIPKEPVFILSLCALTYAVYSAACYFLKPKNWQFWMRVIAIANICFCIATASLMFYYRSEISFIAVVFFVSEILLILVIASMELMTARN